MADGGDGTVAAAVSAGYKERTVEVSGPTGLAVAASFAFDPGTGNAVVEMAQASGLGLLPSGVLNPLATTSFGTGELVRAALDAGAHRIILGVGGSACTDGGAGFLQALGALLRTKDGAHLGPGGGMLHRLAMVDLTTLDPRLEDCELILASDVDNPLLGPDGASHVYGPQKGATQEEMIMLEDGLAHFARMLCHAADAPLVRTGEPGAGAAGGVGFAAMTALGATMQPGVQVMLQIMGFHEILTSLSSGDLVITGEGSLDAQTLRGKVVAGVSAAANVKGVPVVAVCGQQSLTEQEQSSLGIRKIHALTDFSPDMRACFAQAAVLLEKAGKEAIKDWIIT
jgi:glycerate kinase